MMEYDGNHVTCTRCPVSHKVRFESTSDLKKCLKTCSKLDQAANGVRFTTQHNNKMLVNQNLINNDYITNYYSNKNKYYDS